MRLPLWTDEDTTLIHWEEPKRDLIPNQILGRRHHIFLKKKDKTQIRVIMSKAKVIVDFPAPPFYNSPIPRLVYDDLQHLFAPVICVPFVLSGQLEGAGKMEVMHIDFNSRYNFVSSHLLPPRAKCQYEEIESRVVPFHFEEFTHVRVRYEVPLVIRGRNAKKTLTFPFAAFVVSRDDVAHFPYQRIILGRNLWSATRWQCMGRLTAGRYISKTTRRTYMHSPSRRSAQKPGCTR